MPRRSVHLSDRSKEGCVANAPGEQIFPGELAKGLGILAACGDIDCVGASAVELVGAGESAGNYQQMAVEDGMFVVVRYR